MAKVDLELVKMVLQRQGEDANLNTRTVAQIIQELQQEQAAEAGTDRWKEEALRLRVDIAAIELRADVISMRRTTSRLASAEAKLAESERERNGRSARRQRTK